MDVDLFWAKISHFDFFFNSSSFLLVFIDSCHGACRGEPDAGELDVERLAVVIEGGGLEDDARGAHQDGHREDPQEETVQNHRHILPVLNHLEWNNFRVYFWKLLLFISSLFS